MSAETINEIRSIQSKARLLYALFAISLIASPVIPSLVIRNGDHTALALALGFIFVFVAFFAQFRRSKISRELSHKFEQLQVGVRLEKKIPQSNTKEFLIIDKSARHFSLQCIQTGQNILVCKHRVREDFDIAN